MKFNIARQPLIPAFLTLTALSIATVCLIDPHTTGVAIASPESIVPLPGELLTQIQNASPIVSRILTAILIISSGLCIGRISTRYGLYAQNSCLAMPLYGIIVCATLPNGNFLASATASLLLALSMSHFCRACKNGYSFDAIFLASFYLGIIPFISVTALPLVLLLPLAILIFGRTLRETVVAFTGLLLSAGIVCYIAWGSGYPFAEPIMQLGSRFIAGQFVLFIGATPLLQLVFSGIVLLLTIAASGIYLSHTYATGSKPRFILTYNIGVLLLTIALAFTPSATTGVLMLVAIPAALILPVLFIRINYIIATIIYLSLLVAALSQFFLL